MTHELDQRNEEVTVGTLKTISFGFERYNIKGVGRHRTPFVVFDPYVDHSLDQELHEEALVGLVRSSGIKHGMFYGAVPDEELKRWGHGQGWSEQLRFLDDNDPTGQHRRCIEILCNSVPQEELTTAVYRYACLAMNAPIPWFFTLPIMKSNFLDKGNRKSRLGDGGEWTEDAIYFPKLQEYVSTLPFKSVGRVLFFASYPRAGVTTHRDAVLAEHSDHNINFYFNGGSRPSFVYDALNREKIYLDASARSYFFNNRDYHGVDPEPNFRYTLRIDGQFTDDICEKLGLEDGYTWKWTYDN